MFQSRNLSVLEGTGNVHSLTGLNHVMAAGSGGRVSGWMWQLPNSIPRCQKGKEDNFIRRAFRIPRKGLHFEAKGGFKSMPFLVLASVQPITSWRCPSLAPSSAPADASSCLHQSSSFNAFTSWIDGYSAHFLSIDAKMNLSHASDTGVGLIWVPLNQK